MKAVIFNGSLKYPQNSDTHFYCRAMKTKFEEADIDAEVLDLKSYDYESSISSIDELHNDLIKIYDADAVIFTSPACLRSISFTLNHLLERFTSAHTQAMKQGLSLFSNKIFGFGVTFGGASQDVEGKDFNPQPDYDGRFHRFVHEIISGFGGTIASPNFKKNLLHLQTGSPDNNFDGPNREDVLNDEDVLEQFTTFTKNLKKQIQGLKQSTTPACSKKEFLTFFEPTSNDSFGRGFTVGVQQLTAETVAESIKLAENSGKNISFILQSYVGMMERCKKANMYKLANEYYYKIFAIKKKLGGLPCGSGAYRPNDY